MSAQLLGEIKKFLRGLERTQDGLAALYGQKRIATVEARAADMLKLAESEADLTKSLQAHLREREQILARAKQAGLPHENIENLTAHLATTERPLLENQIRRIKAMASILRTESWVQWIVSQRALNHYGELVELIANSGRKAPTYNRTRNERTAQAAIFDASI